MFAETPPDWTIESLSVALCLFYDHFKEASYFMAAYRGEQAYLDFLEFMGWCDSNTPDGIPFITAGVQEPFMNDVMYCIDDIDMLIRIVGIDYDNDPSDE